MKDVIQGEMTRDRETYICMISNEVLCKWTFCLVTKKRDKKRDFMSGFKRGHEGGGEEEDWKARLKEKTDTDIQSNTADEEGKHDFKDRKDDEEEEEESATAKLVSREWKLGEWDWQLNFFIPQKKIVLTNF